MHAPFQTFNNEQHRIVNKSNEQQGVSLVVSRDVSIWRDVSKVYHWFPGDLLTYLSWVKKQLNIFNFKKGDDQPAQIHLVNFLDVTNSRRFDLCLVALSSLTFSCLIGFTMSQRWSSWLINFFSQISHLKEALGAFVFGETLEMIFKNFVIIHIELITITQQCLRCYWD